MSRSVRGSRAAVVGGVLVVAASLLTGCATHTETNHKYFEFGGKALEIRTDSELKVVPARKGQPLHVKQKLKSTGNDVPKSVMELKDGVLRLEARCRRKGVQLPCDGTYTVSLPAGVDLKVRSKEQSVTVSRIKTDIDVVTKYQPITVKKTGRHSKLRMVSRAGFVQGLALRSDEVYAETSLKVVTLNFKDAPKRVVAKVENERATVTLPKGGPKYRVDVRAEDGERCVEVPTDARSGHVIRISTSKGNARALVSTKFVDLPAWPKGSINKDLPAGCLREDEELKRKGITPSPSKSGKRGMFDSWRT